MIERFVLLGFAAVFLAGCATLSGSGGGGSAREVHLFGLPVTLNLDGKPGADGFAVRVYVTGAGVAKGVAIREGTLEVLMFDGVVSTDAILGQIPNQTWRFGPKTLANFEEKTSLGYGYRFALRWNEMPKHGHITVLARYLPAKGEAIYSSPSAITAAAK